MDDGREPRLTDGSIEVTATEEIKSTPFDVESYIEHFQLTEYSNAYHKNANGGGRIRRFFSKSGSPSIILTLDQMLQYQKETLVAPLLTSSAGFGSKASKMFSIIQNFQDTEKLSIISNECLEMIQNLLQMGLKKEAMTDELYMQLLKQSRKNRNPQSKLRVWILFYAVASTMPPSRKHIAMLTHYIHEVRKEQNNTLEIRDKVNGTWDALKKTVKAGARTYLPSLDEIHVLLTNNRMKMNVYFLDGSFEELFYNISTTVIDAVEHIAQIIDLENYQTFSLFKSVEEEEDYVVLEDNKYIADVLIEFESSSRKDSESQKLIFKKRMFRESDDTIMETQFLNLSFVQAQHDFLLGLYPVVYEDAAQLCALQLYSEFGSDLPGEDIQLTKAIERFTSKEIKISNSKEDWKQDVLLKCTRLQCGSREEARYCFLTMLRSLPFGSSIFFHVNRLNDPIGLLPPKIILGINKQGIHFFRPVPKEYLHSVLLEDISKFGSNGKAISMKMRIGNSVDEFQFETEHGEDICIALQQHINDIMVKRYFTTMENAQKVVHEMDSLPTVNFGPDYDQHLKDIQKAIDEADRRYDYLSSLHVEHMNERDQMFAKQQDTLKRLGSLMLETGELNNQVSGAKREVCNLKIKLENMERSLENCRAMLAEDETKVSDYQALVDTAQKRAAEINQSHKRENELKDRLEQLEEERSLLMNKTEQIEDEKKLEVLSLKEGLDDIVAEGLRLYSLKDNKIATLIEELANMTAMYHDSNREIESIKKDREDLIFLKKLKEGIEQRDHEHATIRRKQKSKIQRAESMYNQEKVTRRKIYNKVEDLKGKIRVFARIRPILNLEKTRGQSNVLNIPDELSVSHPWKREDFPREYSFDKVFGPNTTQQDVFKDTHDLIQSAIDGFNVCVFAYGQTGSGKTYTIYGNQDNPGLTFQGIDKLFELLLRGSDKYGFSVSCYMLELYQDILNDLLAPKTARVSMMPRLSDCQSLCGKEKLEVKKDLSTQMVRVKNLTTIDVHSAEELRAAFEEGQRHRHVAATNTNIRSSRSHLIMGIIIETTDLQTQVQTRGKLSFVDLAGSERIKKSNSAGEQLKEAQAINKSLSALGDVISSLARGDSHIPYRNHKLTMLMSDSLGGNAKTLMFVNVSPTDANLDETQNSLTYATRVRSIRNEASKDSNKEILNMKKKMALWKSLSSSVSGKNTAQEMIMEYL
eukprot:g4380.t1